MSLLQPAWDLASTWPVSECSIAVLHRGDTHYFGDSQRVQRIASVSKPLAAYAALIAVEEGSIRLDDAVGQTDCTVKHLLAHAGGYPFEGALPVGKPGAKRIYSNSGFELLAQHVEHSTGIAFVEYIDDAVFAPLGMHGTTLRGSCAKDIYSCAADLTLFIEELNSPILLARETLNEAIAPVFPELSGILPGIGSFDPCPWGLGFEIRGHKDPHWTGSRNSASTFGHFGGIGTFLWIDPVADVSCIMLSEHEFDEWGMKYWPAFSDTVLSCLGR